MWTFQTNYLENNISYARRRRGTSAFWLRGVQSKTVRWKLRATGLSAKRMSQCLNLRFLSCWAELMSQQHFISRVKLSCLTTFCFTHFAFNNKHINELTETAIQGPALQQKSGITFNANILRTFCYILPSAIALWIPKSNWSSCQFRWVFSQKSDKKTELITGFPHIFKNHSPYFFNTFPILI